MEFIFFRFGERINELNDEGADGAMPPPPRIFGLEPLLTSSIAVAATELKGTTSAPAEEGSLFRQTRLPRKA